MAIKVGGTTVVDDGRNGIFVGLELNGTGAAKLPAGTTAQRPTPVSGQLRFNSDNSSFESYDGAQWTIFSGAGSSAGIDSVARTLALLTLSFDTGVKSTTVVTASSITPLIDITDQVNVTALDQAMTIQIPAGTPYHGQRLIFRFRDNGTSRGLSWITTVGGYRSIGGSLPSSTVANKLIYIGCVYNSTDVYWDVISVSIQE